MLRADLFGVLRKNPLFSESLSWNTRDINSALTTKGREARRCLKMRALLVDLKKDDILSDKGGDYLEASRVSRKVIELLGVQQFFSPQNGENADKFYLSVDAKTTVNSFKQDQLFIKEKEYGIWSEKEARLLKILNESLSITETVEAAKPIAKTQFELYADARCTKKLAKTSSSVLKAPFHDAKKQIEQNGVKEGLCQNSLKNPHLHLEREIVVEKQDLIENVHSEVCLPQLKTNSSICFNIQSVTKQVKINKSTFKTDAIYPTKVNNDVDFDLGERWIAAEMKKPTIHKEKLIALISEMNGYIPEDNYYDEVLRNQYDRLVVLEKRDNAFYDAIDLICQRDEDLANMLKKGSKRTIL